MANKFVAPWIKQKPAPVQPTILDAWKQNQIPPEILNAAGVPPYDAYRSAVGGEAFPQIAEPYRPKETKPSLNPIKLWEQLRSGELKPPANKPSAWEFVKSNFAQPVKETAQSYQGGVPGALIGMYETYIGKPGGEKIYEETAKQAGWEQEPTWNPTVNLPAYSATTFPWATPFGAEQVSLTPHIGPKGVAHEIASLPLWLIPAGGGKAKAASDVGVKALKKLEPAASAIARNFVEKELARLGPEVADDIVARVSYLTRNPDVSRELIRQSAEKLGLLGSATETITRAIGELPAIGVGNIRLFRGRWKKEAEGGGRWFTPSLETAQRYAGELKKIKYLDVPADQVQQYVVKNAAREDFYQLPKELAEKAAVIGQKAGAVAPKLTESQTLLNLLTGDDRRFAETALKRGESVDDITRKLSYKYGSGKIPPNLPPKVVAKLESMPLAEDPLAGVREKILLLNERVRSAITKQEALFRSERGARFARAEQKLINAPTAETGQRAALEELGGQLPKATYNPKDVGLTAADKALVKDFIRNNKDFKLTDRVNALDAIDRLFGKFDTQGNRLLPQRNQVKLVNGILGTNLPSGKDFNLLLDILNIPRATLASCDVSGGFRQNVFFLFGHPITTAKNIWQGGIKPFVGEAWNDFAGASNWLLKKSGTTKQIRLNNWTKEIEAAIEANPWYDKMVDAGWPITERSIAGGKIGKMEESFASKLASRIPFVKWAEAGYVNLLNKARVDVGSSCLDKWVRAGVNVDDDFIRMWGQVVGQLTGRGDLEAIRGFLPVMNSFLFSPRLQLARVQLPFTYLQCWKNPAYRPIAREMTRNIVAFVAGNATLIGLGAMAMKVYGKDKISVEFNPLSTDFGRIKMGNTRVDFSGGFIPYIRLIAQLITNRKITAAGELRSLDDWPYGGRWGQITSFAEMKFSPVASAVRDIMQGHDAMGNPIEWTPKGIGAEAYKRLTPMVIQDTIDAINEHGLVEGSIYGTLAFFGATVMTYEPTTKKTTPKKTQPIPFAPTTKRTTSPQTSSKPATPSKSPPSKSSQFKAPWSK